MRRLFAPFVVAGAASSGPPLVPARFGGPEEKLAVAWDGRAVFRHCRPLMAGRGAVARAHRAVATSYTAGWLHGF